MCGFWRFEERVGEKIDAAPVRMLTFLPKCDKRHDLRLAGKYAV
ncbi:hypothetical protein BWQ96_03219 [Gracilariopsis chorda]|uniref:Uncharacterized protein n=1 Tax=Gracilariopsis chorda TaxID=448386 RepID=A0A2V3IY41_9FLOR|nr:hypothetical protein BWQ96_03219 [Gracilariopsis chorda]|eukprot:PXF47029.1 hypothetical protein BWQ96_03219 [Gracilariopsis chorda]